MSTDFFLIITGVTAFLVIAIALIQNKFIPRQAQTLTANPNKPAALRSWLTGHLITFALCEAIAMFGVVLRVLGSTFSQVLPFYLAGVILLLYYGPKKPASRFDPT